MGNSINSQIARAGQSIVWLSNRLYKNSSIGRIFFQNNILSIIFNNYLFINLVLRFLKQNPVRYMYFKKILKYYKRKFSFFFKTYDVRNRSKISFFSLQKNEKILIFFSFLKKKHIEYDRILYKFKFLKKFKYFLNSIFVLQKILKNNKCTLL